MPTLFSSNLLYRRLTIILLIAFAIGWLLNAIWPVLFLTCLVILLWHFQQFHKLIHWLWQSKNLSPPQAIGIWEYIFEGIYQQQKKAREKQKTLQQRIHQFRDGTEALADAAMVVDNDMTIRWANKKVAKLLGIKNKQDIGQRLNNLIRSPQFQKYLMVKDYSKPCTIPSPVNEFVQLEIRFMPYVDDQILLLVRDISQLHRINSMRREFVANVSHELKTPLTVIRGYTEMLLADPDKFDPAVIKSFNAIASQTERMNSLVNQLLELSKVESNDQQHRQRLNFSQLVNTVVHELTLLNQEKEHAIICDIEDNLMLIGNETELKSVCTNLISNAIIYTEANGQIQVSCKKQNNQIIFTVKDNGPGIKPQHLARLTERFYRVDNSRSRGTGGSGLGLSIVKHALANHNSKLNIESSWGRGSEFSASFSLV